MALTADVVLTLISRMTKALDFSTPADIVTVGQNSFPEGSFSLADGNGDGQAQAHFSDLRTVAAGATDSLDLHGSLTGPLGDAFSLVTLRLALIVIKDPLSTKYLRVGPQGVTNAAQLGFGGIGSTVYIEFDRFQMLERINTGWAITAGTADLLPVKNPSAVSIDYGVLLIGTTS